MRSLLFANLAKIFYIPIPLYSRDEFFPTMKPCNPDCRRLIAPPDSKSDNHKELTNSPLNTYLRLPINEFIYLDV